MTTPIDQLPPGTRIAWTSDRRHEGVIDEIQIVETGYVRVIENGLVHVVYGTKPVEVVE